LVRGFTGRLAQGQVDDALGHFRTQPRNARPPRLVAQQAVKTLFHEALLPAPDTVLDLPVWRMIALVPTPSAERDNLGAPNMLLGSAAFVAPAR
jgi:hypothetical protein